MVTTPVITTTTDIDTTNSKYYSEQTKTYADGKLIKTVTVFDKALGSSTSEIVETNIYQNGVLISNERFDAGNHYEFDTKTKTYDLNGVLTGIATHSSNVIAMPDPNSSTGGTIDVTYHSSVVETYTGGTLVSTVRTDEDPKQLWLSVETTHDLTTGGRMVETVLKNGQEITETFNGADKMTAREKTAPDGSSTSEVFDANGVIQSITRIDADDNTVVETYVDGALHTAVYTDVSGFTDSATPIAITWATMTRTYDADGHMVTERQDMDDGRVITKTFGQRPAMDKDGNPTIESYVTEVRTQDTQEANLKGGRGSKGYDETVTTYDIDGNIMSTTTIMDDTDTVVRTYNDAGYEIVKTDVNDSSSFAKVTAHFDQDGTLLDRTILGDNGVSSVSTFDDAGYRVTTTIADAKEADMPDAVGHENAFDGRYAWDTISKSYFDGKLSQALTVYDDGHSLSAVYDDTVIGDVVLTVTKTQSDVIATDKDYWASNTTTYVNVGDKLVHDTVTVLTHAGRETVTTFGGDNVRDSIVVTDKGTGDTGIFKWDTIETKFDATGKMESKLVTDDDGDQTLRLFDTDGKVTDIVIYDGSDSYAWEFRVTSYDGDTKSTSYVTADTLPTDYASYFDQAVPVI